MRAFQMTTKHIHRHLSPGDASPNQRSWQGVQLRPCLGLKRELGRGSRRLLGASELPAKNVHLIIHRDGGEILTARIRGRELDGVVTVVENPPLCLAEQLVVHLAQPCSQEASCQPKSQRLKTQLVAKHLNGSVGLYVVDEELGALLLAQGLGFEAHGLAAKHIDKATIEGRAVVYLLAHCMDFRVAGALEKPILDMQVTCNARCNK